MTLWKKHAGTVITAAGAMAGLGALAIRRALHGPIPDVSGSLKVPGLNGEVVIDRDAWGIPHISASSFTDLYFANGLVHAQDRFWQMELNRRIGSGTLSMLFGEVTLEADRLMRHLGLRRAAEDEARQLAGEDRELLEAYCRGVNYYLANFPGRWPLEFTLVRAVPPPLLRWRPDPWEITDIFTYSKLVALGLCGNWREELVRAAVLEQVGPERAAELEPIYAEEHPLVIPGTQLPEALTARILQAYEELQPFLAGAGTGGFSNGWVVDGTRTANGKPLLANDPHLELQMPSVWYELELNGPGFMVVGAGFPGAPGVVIGHNRHIAWGLTTAPIDAQDLIVERLNPAIPNQYEDRGAWREGRVVREVIAVRGRSEPVVEEVLITHHGPVISAVLPGEQRCLALRWTALRPGGVAQAVLRYNRASNWQEFTEALRFWDAPAHNFIYADVSGNIGYYLPGAVPIRSKGTGALPVPGWTGEYEWTGFVPFDELPHAFNPPEHQIITANNKPVGDEYPYALGNEWMAGYRAQRIHELLDGRGDLSIDDFRQMQKDIRSLPGLAAAAVLRNVLGVDELERAALKEATHWDGTLSADSVGGCICLVFQHHLLRAVFGVVLGDLAELYLGTGLSPLTPINGFYSRSLPLLYSLIGRRDDAWFARMGVPQQTWDGALRSAWRGTITFLSERLGPDLADWRWGRLNSVRFVHALGLRPPFDRLFNRGPVEMGGDDNTVAAVRLPLYNPHKHGGWASSYRQIVDLGGLGNSLAMHTTGQSGHVRSEHYADMIPAWREGRYHPLSLPVGDVRRELGGRLLLEPSTRDSNGTH